MKTPYFSIVITTYNRADIIRRCVDSCLNQSFTDFEVIVVDDASTDKTSVVLTEISDHRFTFVRHPENRGISPARHTGVKKALGAWVVGLDSDWELLPDALDNLHEVTTTLPDEIIVVRSRLRWDTGRITPAFVPDEPINYEGRIKWVEVEGGTDALMCTRKQVFEKVIYESNRRGAQEGLFQLNLALHGKILYLKDILGIEYSDAPNGYSRNSSLTHLNMLRRNAPDMLWMYDEVLRLHGESLKKWGPRQYHDCFRGAALECFFLGQRWRGIRYMARYLSLRPLDVYGWFILGLGLLGPKPTLYGKWVKRRIYGE